MRRIICVTILILLSEVVNAQNKYFERKIDWADFNSGRKVIEKDDLSLTITGNYLNVNDYLWHGYFLRTNQYGDTLLLHMFPEFGDSYFGSLLPTEYGYAISGYIYQDIADDYSYRGFLLQLDPDGNQLQFDYTGTPTDTMPSYIYDLIRTPDNGYLLAGHKINEWVFPYYWKFYLVKLNQNGQTEWERIYDNYTYSNIFSSIVPADDGGYYFWGVANLVLLAGEQASDLILAKVDEQGIMQWDSIYNLEPPIHGTTTLTKLSDGNLLAIAASGTNGDTQRIIKFSLSGAIIWQVTFPDYGCGISQVVELPNSELVFTNCYYPVGISRTDMAIFKLSANGSPRWWRQYGNSGFHDYGYDIILARDGGFVVTGRQDTTGGSSVWVVRTNCMGLVTPLPQASFSWQADAINPFSLQFTNLSHFVYADSIDGGKYIWDWGDGSPPVTFTSESFQEVFHNYPAPGSFTVTLTAVVCQDTSMVQATIETLSGAGGTVGLPTNPQKEEPTILIYPNPAQNTLTFSYTDVLMSPSGDLGVSKGWGVNLKLLSLTGQTVLETTLVSTGSTSQTTISVAHLPEGMYLYSVEQSGSVLARGKVAVVGK